MRSVMYGFDIKSHKEYWHSEGIADANIFSKPWPPSLSTTQPWDTPENKEVYLKAFYEERIRLKLEGNQPCN